MQGGAAAAGPQRRQPAAQRAQLVGVEQSFNVVSLSAGMTFDFIPKSPEVMLKLGCDVHRWMTAFVGVMAHPYFAVSDAAGRSCDSARARRQVYDEDLA